MAQDEVFRTRAWDNQVKIMAADGGKPSSLREKFPGGIQVVFKLTSIHLTPEKPTYRGGDWRVEGSCAETICASAIYYFDDENITDSHLAFRQPLGVFQTRTYREATGDYPLKKHLGLDCPFPYYHIQTLGQVLTREGRLLVFPNCLQHQVQPFKLKDETRPGHRKILAMFLISPQRPILSSAQVPPQRRDWWEEEILNDSSLGKFLPGELFNDTMAMVDSFPFPWETALLVRQNMMREMARYNDQVTRF